MKLNWNMLRTSGPPVKMMLHDLKSVPEELKCMSCATEFTHSQQKSRHYQAKKGKSICKKEPAKKGRKGSNKKHKKPKPHLNALTVQNIVPPGPRITTQTPDRSKKKFFDKTIASNRIRVPWSSSPMYLSRSELRKVS